ncbi:MAG: hypothetical protein IKB28_05890 [Clostridia bacterium]|nr:hypothetical protein [Clostridia bacterium]
MSNKPTGASETFRSGFAGFRRENLLSCFFALCENTSMTRAELADATRLSIMTTGKIADAMIERGIWTEEKLPACGAGRRPGTLQFHAKPLFLVLDLSSRRFCAYALSPTMQAKELCMHDYNDIFPFDDNLLIFLNAVRRACNTDKEVLPYLAVMTAPEDDKRQCITRSLAVSPRTREHMVRNIEKILHRDCDLIIDEITAAQTYFNSLSEFQDLGCGVYVSLSDMMYASVWMRGNLLCPRICRIGDLLMPEHKKVADALADALCTEEAVLPVAYAVSTLESFFTPDRIIFESCRFGLDEAFLEGVYDQLKPILPANNRIIPMQICKATPGAAVCGCAAELRRTWFYERTGIK